MFIKQTRDFFKITHPQQVKAGIIVLAHDGVQNI